MLTNSIIYFDYSKWADTTCVLQLASGVVSIKVKTRPLDSRHDITK